MKKMLCVLMAVLSLAIFAGCGGGGGGGKTAQERSDEQSIKVIQAAIGCTEEIAKKSNDIMKAVELYPVTSMTVLKKDFNTWDVKAGGIKNTVVSTKEKGITKVLTQGKILYENEQFKMKASDFLVSRTDAEKCKRRAERVVKERLKDPDSVKFDEKNWGTKKENGMFVAQGVYRAKNSFGGYVVEFYTVTLDKDFNVKTVKSEPYR